MDYIEAWYNRRRPNRRAGGLPPATASKNTKPATTNPWPRNRNQLRNCLKNLTCAVPFAGAPSLELDLIV